MGGAPQYRPQNAVILIIGTLKMVSLLLGNPQVGLNNGIVNLEGTRGGRVGWCVAEVLQIHSLDHSRNPQQSRQLKW